MAPRVKNLAPARLRPVLDAEMPETAMIMAAGFGTRMRPITDTCPKPLVEVLGRPMIDHTLGKLARAGIKRVVLNLHYKGAMLRQHLETSRPEGMEIMFSQEDDILDTGGGVVKALPLLGDAPFFVLNGDMIWRDGTMSVFSMLADRWDDGRMDALLLMVPTVSAVGYYGMGDFTMLSDVELKRRSQAHVAPFLFGGIQLVHPRFFREAPAGNFSTNLLWDRAGEAGRLYGVRHESDWMQIDTPDAIPLANEAFGQW
jgi:MurNAc alpha-1-phosphate uridylyltransferase